MTLELIMTLIRRGRELIPYLVAIVDAPTIRGKVRAVYDAAKQVSGITPTPIDDNVVAFIEGAPGRLDLAVDLIVEGLELLGFEDGEVRPGPFGTVGSGETEKLRAALQDKSEAAGFNVFALIAAIRAVKEIIEGAPTLIDGIKRLFPHLFGEATETRVPSPTVVEED